MQSVLYVRGIIIYLYFKAAQGEMSILKSIYKIESETEECEKSPN